MTAIVSKREIETETVPAQIVVHAYNVFGIGLSGEFKNIDRSDTCTMSDCIVVAVHHHLSLRALDIGNLGKAVAPHGVDGIADLIGRADKLIGNGSIILHVGNLVLVVGEGGACSPAEIATVVGAEPVITDCEFDTSVDNRSNIGNDGGEAGGRVEIHSVEDVFADFVIVVERAAKTVVEECEVNTDVGSAVLLPAEVGVSRRGNGRDRTIGGAVQIAGRGGHNRGRTLIDVTGHAVGEAELKEVGPRSDFAHKRFLMRVPACTYRPQRLAAELGVKAEYVGIVLTERPEDVVAFVVGVGQVGVA